MIETISFEEAEPLLDWLELVEELESGHRQLSAKIGDQLLHRGKDTILNRSAVVDGLGIAVKTATVFPGNSDKGLPAINGAMTLFDDRTGIPEALIDFRLITKWKTAADSLLAAKHLARPESSLILIIGAGAVAHSLVEAYSAMYPKAEFLLWNRTVSNAEKLVAAMSERSNLSIAKDLAKAAGNAGIICCATMSCDPVIRGEWLSAGTHLDLIGAYRPDMREADDAALRKSRIFVDSRETTIGHIGEIAIPIAAGTIGEHDIRADFRDIAGGTFRRISDEEITLFKNGGGAHLDLMTARYVLKRWSSR